jgi:Raf kinase inhibitor-like YbhB/YbcL family protein
MFLSIAHLILGAAMTWQLTSSAFEPGRAIPERLSCEGADVSPDLRWTDPPAGTKSVALIVEDPDAPGGSFIHWVAFNLPAAERHLDGGIKASSPLPGGALQGRNDFGKLGYGGPCPPKGQTHRYYFRLYALGSALALKAGASASDLREAIKGHLLGETALMGTFQR